MSLILKQESSGNVPTPPAGKGTIFLNTSDQVVVKDSAGNISVFPTITTSNTQVIFNANGTLTGDSNLTFNNSTDTLTVSNLTVTGTLTAGDIAVSSIANGTSNVDIIGVSGNVTISVGGNANILTATGTGINVAGTLNATGVITGNGSGLSSLAYANIDQFTTTGLTVDELYLQAVTRLVVTTPVFNYNIDQYAGDNPTIYVNSGQTIAFNLSVAGHPFLIQTSGNANYSTGLTHVSTTGTVSTGSSAQGKTTGTLYWKVPYGITGNYKYQCQSHGSMNGNIVISDANVSNLSVSSATTAGTVTTAAQPNITSLGTLTSLTTSGNAVIGGNLTVNGNITYINVDNLSVEDPIIEMGGGPNGAPLSSDDGKDRGSLLHYYTSAPVDAFMGWDTSNSEFAFGSNVSVSSDVVTFNTLGNIRANTFIGNASGTSGAFTGNVTAGNVYANSGTVGGSLLTGTLTTASQPNVTSVGTLTSLLVGATANTTDFPNAKAIVSQDNSGQTHSENIGLVGEAVADSGNTSIWGIGVLGEARANGATRATGVQGGAYVTNSADSGAAVGVRGYSTMTHSGGYNIGVLGNASGSGYGNYAFYVQDGGIGSIEKNTFWDLTDNSNVALAFNSSGKANILGIETTDNAEGVFMSGYLNVVGNANVGNINGTGGNFTGNVTAGNVYANSGTIGASLLTGTLTTNAQPNVTSLGTLTSLSVSGNITSANFIGVLANGNSNIGIPSSNGNINVSVAGNANVVVVTGTGVNVAGTVNVSSTLNVTGNANVGNLGATGVVATTLGGTLTTNAQPNVTSVGTLTSLTVSGNTSSGNYNTSGTVVASTLQSNVANGTSPLTVVSTTKVSNLNADLLDGFDTSTSATANTVVVRNADGNITGNNISGTLSTAAQPNITSVGTLTSLAVTGNTTSGNVYANSGTIGASLLTGTLTTNAQPNITSVGTLTSLTVTGNVAAGNLTTTGVLSVTGTGVSSIAGNLDMTSNNIINLATPVNATDAATKQYVDDVAQGLHTHDSCNAATDGTLATISGGTVTYNNGTSGVGATLTTTGSYTTIDGVTLSNGMRILVKNEANAAHNGIYDRTSSTVLTRSSDFDTPTEMAGGDFTFVTAGTLYDNTGWVMTDPVTTVGTTAVNWVQFSGAGTYTAGTGLTLTGSQFSITNTAVSAASYGNGDRVASFTVNSQGQLTAASNTVITANAANLTGTTLASSIVTSSLTSVGTLTSLAVTGNVTAGNVYANSGTIGASLLTGTLTTAAQPNITSVGTLTSLTVTGNVAAGNLNATSAVVASTLTSNVSTGTAPLTVTSTTRVANLNVAYANVADFINASAGTGNNFIIFANAASGNVSEVTSTGLTANLSNNSITATTFVGALSGAATTAGTVTTNAQPNITSVGTLTSLTVAGNITQTSGYEIMTTNAAVSAAGTVQANATALTTQVNVTSTVASGSGVALPTAAAGLRITIINTAANAVLVYPASGGQINSLGTNASYSLGAGARLDFQAVSTTQWYTLNATYA